MSRIAKEQFRHSQTGVPSIADALQQIEAEYREMPGLGVTEAQPQRLWGLYNTTCKRALDTLVHRGVLRRTRGEAYVRAETFSRPSALSTREGASGRHRNARERKARAVARHGAG